MSEQMQDEVITAHELGFSYGNRKAVNGLSFTVQPGEVVGLLGPNGAGKTTTVRMLNGLLLPSAGTARVLGYDPAVEGENLRKQTGVLTETPALYERLTARQNLQFFGEMAEMPQPVLRSRIEEVLELFELRERGDDRVSTYSKGMKQRLALGRALLHNPGVLFLDEPTSGLDPEASLQVMELIDSLRRQNGHTVLLCTHNLFEAQRLCDRVLIMNSGRLLAAGRLDDLRKQLSQGLRLNIRILEAFSAEKLAELGRMSGVNSLKPVQDGLLQLDIEAEAAIPGIVKYLVENGLSILEVQPVQQSLEEIYFTLQREAEGATL